ncbi:hypothetical protein CAPTEDRAFT_206397 [Capitella teleta]|uniref:POU-specific domain-containing protein n=1 Tax=Capitella teleta TaxID=283909 RepID=R7T8R8_CAPTE|nr:hypothetical protein CAPTEDRAFT_206397 [Capitella teleta]|eukprot:ELT90025.1 hypothetical protein CAPTEDRAFT_206397 [Capitella teleta]
MHSSFGSKFWTPDSAFNTLLPHLPLPFRSLAFPPISRDTFKFYQTHQFDAFVKPPACFPPVFYGGPSSGLPLLPLQHSLPALHSTSARFNAITSAASPSVRSHVLDNEDAHQLSPLKFDHLTPNEENRDSSSAVDSVDSADLRELEQFALNFKSRRIKLGFTQTNVAENEEKETP